jgi:hypothetical protein
MEYVSDVALLFAAFDGETAQYALVHDAQKPEEMAVLTAHRIKRFDSGVGGRVALRGAGLDFVYAIGEFVTTKKLELTKAFVTFLHEREKALGVNLVIGALMHIEHTRTTPTVQQYTSTAAAVSAAPTSAAAADTDQNPAGRGSGGGAAAAVAGAPTAAAAADLSAAPTSAAAADLSAVPTSAAAAVAGAPTSAAAADADQNPAGRVSGGDAEHGAKTPASTRSTPSYTPTSATQQATQTTPAGARKVRHLESTGHRNKFGWKHQTRLMADLKVHLTEVNKLLGFWKDNHVSLRFLVEKLLFLYEFGRLSHSDGGGQPGRRRRRYRRRRRRQDLHVRAPRPQPANGAMVARPRLHLPPDLLPPRGFPRL